jgi:outer membrane protein assembly factor BamD (BamD/ComL family)
MAPLDPTPPDPDGLLPLARERLAAAEQERKLAGLYAEGLRLLDAGQPADAIRRFEAVQALSPGYRQTEGLLVRARQELDARRAAEEREARLADLYGRATRALDADQWEAAQGYLEQIGQLAPGYRDADALAERARQALAEKQAAERRRAEMNDLYERANSQLRLENWAETERLCRQILDLEPHYRDAETLLAKARNRLAAQRAAEERAAREAAALPPPPTARPGKPTTLPEEIKPRPKPKDLPH